MPLVNVRCARGQLRRFAVQVKIVTIIKTVIAHKRYCISRIVFLIFHDNFSFLGLNSDWGTLFVSGLVTVDAGVGFLSDPGRGPRDFSFELGVVTVEAEFLPDSGRSPARSFFKVYLVRRGDGCD